MTRAATGTGNEEQARRRRGATLLGMAAGLMMCAQAAVADPPPFDVEEVAPGNFVHFGKHVNFEDPAHDDIANIGFIIGDGCVAVIDTGGSVAVARALKDAIREYTQTPICYVINTHVHFDHVLGNVVFRDEKPTFIGHVNLPGAIQSNRKFFLESFGADLGANASEADIIAPDRTVEDTLELDLGGRTLVLSAYPEAHSATDISVFDESTGTLWLGDLLFRERVPAIDGSVKGWIAVLDALAKQEGVKRVIPGHGTVADSLPAALADERRYLQLLIEEARPIIAEGGTIEQAMERVGISEHDHWQLWDQHHRRNVSRAFTELEWE